jgi:hypothetical protein
MGRFALTKAALADPRGDDRPLSGALYLSAPNTPTAAQDPTNRLPVGRCGRTIVPAARRKPAERDRVAASP